MSSSSQIEHRLNDKNVTEIQKYLVLLYLMVGFRDYRWRFFILDHESKMENICYQQFPSLWIYNLKIVLYLKILYFIDNLPLQRLWFVCSCLEYSKSES